MVDQTTHSAMRPARHCPKVVFYVAPNAQPGEFTLQALRLPDNADAAPARLEGVRLTVPLARPLAPDCTQVIRLHNALNPVPMGGGYFPQQGYLGHAENQPNLGHWIPTIAHYDQGEWLTPPRINVGEQAFLPATDFDVTLHAPACAGRSGRRWAGDRHVARPGLAVPTGRRPRPDDHPQRAISPFDGDRIQRRRG